MSIWDSYCFLLTPVLASLRHYSLRQRDLHPQPGAFPHELYLSLLTPVNLNYTPDQPKDTTAARLAYLIYSIQLALRIPLIFLNLVTIALNLIWG
jgi:hypothetical protein